MCGLLPKHWEGRTGGATGLKKGSYLCRWVLEHRHLRSFSPTKPHLSSCFEALAMQMSRQKELLVVSSAAMPHVTEDISSCHDSNDLELGIELGGWQMEERSWHPEGRREEESTSLSGHGLLCRIKVWPATIPTMWLFTRDVFWKTQSLSGHPRNLVFTFLFGVIGKGSCWTAQMKNGRRGGKVRKELACLIQFSSSFSL